MAVAVAMEAKICCETEYCLPISSVNRHVIIDHESVQRRVQPVIAGDRSPSGQSFSIFHCSCETGNASSTRQSQQACCCTTGTTGERLTLLHFLSLHTKEDSSNMKWKKNKSTEMNWSIIDCILWIRCTSILTIKAKHFCNFVHLPTLSALPTF